MVEPEQDNDLKERQRIYYSAIVDAYIESSMEKDRSLLSLSAGGIGLLVTLMSTIGVNSIFDLFLYIICILSFGVAIFLILYVFKLNKAYLLRLANNEQPNDTKLKKIDNAIYFIFMFAVITLFTIGLSTAINQLNNKETYKMSDDNKKTKRVIESVQDLSKLRPDSDSTDMKKSLQGLDKLKPKPASGTETSGSSSDSGKSKE